MLELYVFSSANDANISIGYERKLWAVSMADYPQFLEKRQRWSAGIDASARGIIWSVERRGFCMPFRFGSKVMDEIVSNVWQEPWRFPFAIEPLAEPEIIAQERYDWGRWAVTERLRQRVRMRQPARLRNPFNVQIQQMFKGVNGINVFNPNQISRDEWREILEHYGGVELVQKDSASREPRPNPAARLLPVL